MNGVARHVKEREVGWEGSGTCHCKKPHEREGGMRRFRHPLRALRGLWNEILAQCGHCKNEAVDQSGGVEEEPYEAARAMACWCAERRRARILCELTTKFAKFAEASKVTKPFS